MRKKTECTEKKTDGQSSVSTCDNGDSTSATTAKKKPWVKPELFKLPCRDQPPVWNDDLRD